MSANSRKPKPTMTEKAMEVMKEAIAAETQQKNIPLALAKYKEAAAALTAALTHDHTTDRDYKAKLGAYIDDVKRKIVQLEGVLHPNGSGPSSPASPHSSGAVQARSHTNTSFGSSPSSMGSGPSSPVSSNPSALRSGYGPQGPSVPNGSVLSSGSGSAPSSTYSSSPPAPAPVTDRKITMTSLFGKSPTQNSNGNRPPQGQGNAQLQPAVDQGSMIGAPVRQQTPQQMLPAATAAGGGVMYGASTVQQPSKPNPFAARRQLDPAQMSGPQASPPLPSPQRPFDPAAKSPQVGPQDPIWTNPMTPWRGSKWESTEQLIASKRVALAADAIAAALGVPTGSAPRVGLCLSGGGWRAMESAVALFDGLSIPLQSTATGKPVKPLDFVSHAFGLSGGSWMLFCSLLGATKGRNPFHATEDNPWLYGPKNQFNMVRHNYNGLIAMTDNDNVDAACYRTNFRRDVGFLATRVGADSTIAAVLASTKLGDTLVERWSNFLANDILRWADEGFQLPKDAQKKIEAEVKEKQEQRLRAISDKVKNMSLTPEQATKQQQKILLKEETDKLLSTLAKHPSRSTRFASLGAPIASGDFPFVVCCAIATKKLKGAAKRREREILGDLEEPDFVDYDALAVAQGAKPKHHPRIYDWVEFSPFFVRNSINGVYYPSTDLIQGRFSDEVHPVPLNIHHLMGVCGSAFACDISSAMPVGLQRTVSRSLELPTNPIIGFIGRGTTYITDQAKAAPPLGECRDAGIDINVPLPPMCAESGRNFDIIIVMDAGSGSTNAHELQRAVDLGYLPPMNINPEAPFKKGQHVRVYRSPNGGPTVIYFLGLCDRGTHRIISTPEMIRQDAAKIRERVQKQLVPVLLKEMRAAARRSEKSSSLSRSDTLSLAQDPSQPGPELMEFNDEDLDFEDDEDFYQGIAEGINEDVRTIMLAAAVTGAVHNEFDAFSIAEQSIIHGTVEERNRSLFAIEAASVVSFFGGLPPVKLQDAVPKALLEELIQFGVIVKQPGSEGFFSKPLLLVAPVWAAHFAAVALVSQIARSLKNSAALIALGRANVPQSSGANLATLPLHVPSSIWMRMAYCIRHLVETAQVAGAEDILKAFAHDLFRNFESFLKIRTKFSDEEKELALRNFAAALTDCGLDREILTLLERQSMTDGERLKVAETAARCGNLVVLRYLEKYPGALDQPSVLAAAYASTDAEIVRYLKESRRVRLTFLESVEKGYLEAVMELGRQRENQNSQEAGLIAVRCKQEKVANILYNQGNRAYRRWLVGLVKAAKLPWTHILERATAAQERRSIAVNEIDRGADVEDDTVFNKLTSLGRSAKEVVSEKVEDALGKEKVDYIAREANEVAETAKQKFRNALDSLTAVRAFWKK